MTSAARYVAFRTLPDSREKREATADFERYLRQSGEAERYDGFRYQYSHCEASIVRYPIEPHRTNRPLPVSLTRQYKMPRGLHFAELSIAGW